MFLLIMIQESTELFVCISSLKGQCVGIVYSSAAV